MSRRVLSIDLETYSDVDLPNCGVYRYVEGDFHILLFAYAFDDEETKCVDMACGEQLPAEVVDALQDDSIIKSAWNAQFERTCLSKYLGTQLSPDAWQCTMVWAASLSLPLKLATAAQALKTAQQKDAVGERLIRYFSIPCKPTKSNGGRTRNLPEHAPEDWKLFKSYCIQDVETERDIRRRLEKFPLLPQEWDYYHMDQRINDRGILIDKELVQQAIICNMSLSEEMTKRAYALTGLENPNSVSQLKGWLEERGIEVDSLGKKNVASLITDLDRHSADGEALDMMKLRLQMAKSSVKKYQAAERYICQDGRAHGLFQFSGAQRTQRWCLTGDHEILTDKGWLRLEDWRGGKIVCWNPNQEMVSFQKANALCFEYNGPIYHYEDKRIDQISTPDHKMRVKKRYNGEWTDDTVCNMAKYRPSIPFTGRRQTMPGLEHAELRVLVMTQADGCYKEDGMLCFHFKKKRKIERCKHLLRQAGIYFTVNECRTDGTTQIKIPSREQPMYLRMFHDKTFGMWLLDESPDVFFDELRYWDGSQSAKNSIQYTTTNKVNADIVQAFAHTSGRCAKMKTVIRDKEHPNWSDAYYLDIWLTPKNCHEIRVKPTVSQFNGKVYCAETPTGYFLVRRNGKVWVTGNSGRGIQLQNLPQNHIATLDEARELVKMGCFDMIEALYGNTPDILSQLIRTMLIPKEGCEFIVADFSAIEARVLAWLAGEQWRLDAFQRGEDIYCASASQMFGVPVVKHGINGELRQKGKVAELACGYGGGAGALISMGALDMGLKEDELPDIISSWRDANPEIVKFWYTVEKAAIETVKDHTDRSVGRIGFQFSANTLWIVLPSGRRLAYIKPKLQPNRFGRMALTFEGLGANNKWTRGETYSGKLTENITQATARDLLAEAMWRMERAGLDIVGHVHDEVILEVPKGQYTVDDVCNIMNRNPAWADGLPLSSAGYTGNYYFKD